MIVNERAAARRSEHVVTTVLRELADQELTVELITPDEQRRWNKLIRRGHYLKEHRLVGESLRYVAKQNGQWIALLGWSSAAFHLRDRDAWIGWSDAQRQARRHLVACNCRFLLLPPQSRGPNQASQILSLNLRRLSDDWMTYYQHPILLAETFVDPQRFEGTCYRAANWTEIGLTKGFGRSHLDFYQLHAHPKSIFVYPLRRNSGQLLSAPVLPPTLAPFQRTAPPHQYPLSHQQTQSLLEALRALPDPRRNKGWRHRQIASIVALATTAMIAGNNSLLAIGQFAQSLGQKQLRCLGAARDRKTKQYLAPSETTIRRVIQRLDPKDLDTVVSHWLRSHLDTLQISALAVDGQCARTASKINGQSIQLFSALDTQTQIVCRQIRIPAKTNEIPCLKDLLDPLDLRGTLVSADALNTQKTTAAHLVEVKHADYLLPVKDNQPKLFRTLARLSQTNVFFPSRHHLRSSPRPT